VNTELNEARGESRGNPVVLFKGVAPVFVDQKITRGVVEREVENLAQIGGRVLPHRQFHPVHHRALGLEHLAGRGQLSGRLVERESCFTHGG
jgi:hypothetical protein